MTSSNLVIFKDGCCIFFSPNIDGVFPSRKQELFPLLSYLGWPGYSLWPTECCDCPGDFKLQIPRRLWFLPLEVTLYLKCPTVCYPQRVLWGSPSSRVERPGREALSHMTDTFVLLSDQPDWQLIPEDKWRGEPPSQVASAHTIMRNTKSLL